jgi:hypothetical protein
VVKVITKSNSIANKYVKNAFERVVIVQEEAKQIGKINKVSSKKSIEIPSAPSVKVRLLSGTASQRSKN